MIRLLFGFKKYYLVYDRTITQNSFNFLSTKVSFNLSQYKRNQFKDMRYNYLVIYQVINYNLAKLVR